MDSANRRVIQADPADGPPPSEGTAPALGQQHLHVRLPMAQPPDIGRQVLVDGCLGSFRLDSFSHFKDVGPQCIVSEWAPGMSVLPTGQGVAPCRVHLHPREVLIRGTVFAQTSKPRKRRGWAACDGVLTADGFLRLHRKGKLKAELDVGAQCHELLGNPTEGSFPREAAASMRLGLVLANQIFFFFLDSQLETVSWIQALRRAARHLKERRPRSRSFGGDERNRMGALQHHSDDEGVEEAAAPKPTNAVQPNLHQSSTLTFQEQVAGMRQLQISEEEVRFRTRSAPQHPIGPDAAPSKPKLLQRLRGLLPGSSPVLTPKQTALVGYKFGLPLADMQAATQQVIPFAVQCCVVHLHGTALREPGLFRECGSMAQIHVIQEALQRGENPFTKDVHFDPNAVAGCLKRFFQLQPEPFFTTSGHNLLMARMDAASKQSLDTPATVAAITEVLGTLPVPRRELIAFMLQFLAEISSQAEVNHMSARNLAIIFGSPTWLGAERDLLASQHDRHFMALVELCILHFPACILPPPPPSSGDGIPPSPGMTHCTNADTAFALLVSPEHESLSSCISAASSRPSSPASSGILELLPPDNSAGATIGGSPIFSVTDDASSLTSVVSSMSDIGAVRSYREMTPVILDNGQTVMVPHRVLTPTSPASFRRALIATSDAAEDLLTSTVV